MKYETTASILIYIKMILRMKSFTEEFDTMHFSAVYNQDITQTKKMRLCFNGKGEDKVPRSQKQKAIIIISTR